MQLAFRLAVFNFLSRLSELIQMQLYQGSILLFSPGKQDFILQLPPKHPESFKGVIDTGPTDIFVMIIPLS